MSSFNRTSVAGRCGTALIGAVIVSCLSLNAAQLQADEEPVAPRRQLVVDAARDQDDVCFWVHPQDHTQSTIIASDKSANFLFVYELNGNLLQQVAVTKPGNIDIRQGVKLNGQPADIVVVNQRSGGFKLCVFRVNPESRKLERLDAQNLLTGPNYGGCLYLSRVTGQLSYLCTSEAGTVEQHEISGNERGGVVAKKLRSWPVGKCEGAVADDQAGTFYIAEESLGIWKVAAEPGGATPGELIARVGKDDNLTGDLEGLTIFRQRDGAGCLIVSDQQSHRFVAFDLAAPHKRLGEFRIAGVQQTDGIDLLPISLGPDFSEGVFACHNDLGRRAVQLSSWADIRRLLPLPKVKP